MNFKYLIILPVLILSLGLIQAEDVQTFLAQNFKEVFYEGVDKGFDEGFNKGFDEGFNKGLKSRIGRRIEIGSELGEHVGFEEGVSVTICAAAVGFGLYKTGKNLFGYARNRLKYKSDLVTSRLGSRVPVWRLSSEDAKLKLADIGRLVAPANPAGSEAYSRACYSAEVKSLSDATKFDQAKKYASQYQKDFEELK